MASTPGETSIVLKGTYPNGVPLVAIGYRYSTRMTLYFVMMEDSGECCRCCLFFLYICSVYCCISNPVYYCMDTGTTRHGKPYEMKWADSHKNVHIRHVDRPDAAISKFFEQSNTIDSHNQLRQGQLALEKCWVTQDCWFRLQTTFVGINVTGTFRIAAHHSKIPKGNYPIREFAGVFPSQLLHHAKALETTVAPRNLKCSLHFKSPTLADDTPARVLVMPNHSQIQPPEALYSLIDQNGKEHHYVRLKKARDKNGKHQTKRRTCFACKENNKTTMWGQYCYTCNMSFCTAIHKQTIDCFKQHAEEMCHSSDRAKRS
jgi:hypothetical protein